MSSTYAKPEDVRAFVKGLESGGGGGGGGGSSGGRTADVSELARVLSRPSSSSSPATEPRPSLGRLAAATPTPSSSAASATETRPSLGRLAAGTPSASPASAPSDGGRPQTPGAPAPPPRIPSSALRRALGISSSEPPPPRPPSARPPGSPRQLNHQLNRRAPASAPASAPRTTSLDFSPLPSMPRLAPRPKAATSSKRPADFGGAAQLFTTPPALKQSIRRARAERESLAALVRSVRSRGMALSRGARRAANAATSKARSPIPHIPRGRVDAQALQEVRQQLRRVRQGHRDAVAAIEEDVRRSSGEVARRLAVAAAPAPQAAENEAPADMIKRLRAKLDALRAVKVASPAAPPAPKPRPPKPTRRPPPKPEDAAAKEAAKAAREAQAKAAEAAREEERERQRRESAARREKRRMMEARGRARADPRKLIRRFLGRPSPPRSLADFRKMFGGAAEASPEGEPKGAASPPSPSPAAAAASPSPQPQPKPRRAAAGRPPVAGRKGVVGKKGTRCSPGYNRGPGDLCYPREAVAEINRLIKGKAPARRRRKIEREVGQRLPSAVGFPVPRTLSRQPSSLRRMYAREQTVPAGLRVVKSPPSQYRIERKTRVRRS
jgi:hypothetical protein